MTSVTDPVRNIQFPIVEVVIAKLHTNQCRPAVLRGGQCSVQTEAPFSPITDAVLCYQALVVVRSTSKILSLCKATERVAHDGVGVQW